MTAGADEKTAPSSLASPARRLGRHRNLRRQGKPLLALFFVFAGVNYLRFLIQQGCKNPNHWALTFDDGG